ncbi:4'-phosphopantetheinyl transferase family protein [Oceanicella actignis]|uniref:4'-phosphopantetheinyl transferase family protein n=1 Tax=Oceanicella actignis TaxID=1189325 RepID=UPI0011E62C08|nr:4'-phosphopantetheinyl transferase superfamily protein [Oceanicella actignis]TYO88760.1 4'-phosphopantetheinyl transferase EntD [Oceanicella actignis]
MSPEAVQALARGLFPAGVAVAAADPRAPASGLFGEEAAAVARAVEPRRREFAAGRRAARAALASLGIAPAAIPMGADRAPVWPAGAVGSISHTAPRPGATGPAACAAAAARADAFGALGLDVEGAAPLAPALRAQILVPAEAEALEARPEAERGRLAKLIFCAKECAYKAQYPLTGALFGFEGMRIDWSFAPDGRAGRFAAVFLRPAGAFAPGDRLEGRFAFAGGLVAAGVALRQAPVSRR